MAQVNTTATRLLCCQGLCPLIFSSNVLSPPLVLILLKGAELFAEARTWMSFVTWMVCPLAVSLCGSPIVLCCGAAADVSQLMCGSRMWGFENLWSQPCLWEEWNPVLTVRPTSWTWVLRNWARKSIFLIIYLNNSNCRSKSLLLFCHVVFSSGISSFKYLSLNKIWCWGCTACSEMWSSALFIFSGMWFNSLEKHFHLRWWKVKPSPGVDKCM